MTISKLFAPACALALAAFCVGCEKDDTNTTSGQLNLEITDGPADDPNVKAVFVTVAAVKIDGQNFDGFSGKKTIDLMAYQHGNVAALGLGDLDARSYQNITLVLDVDRDASGNTPGCYVQTLDNVKHRLSADAQQEITVAKNFIVEQGQKTNLVIDFDLRKSIRYQSSGGSDQYDFVSSSDLNASLRAVVKAKTGTVKGKCTNNIIASDRIVVYAYKKGQFNRAAEVQAKEGVAFKNAVTSAAVDGSGNYHLSFLEEGEYELQFASFKDTNSDGKLELTGTLLLTSVLDLTTINIGANAQVQVDIIVAGMLPL